MLTGKYGAVTLFTLLFIMLTFALQTFLSSVSLTLVQMLLTIPALNNVILTTVLIEFFNFVIAVLLGVFDIGVTMYFLNFACGGQYESNDLYAGFQYGFRKSLLLSLIINAVAEICMIPYQYLTYQQQLAEKTDLSSLIWAYLAGTVVYYALSSGIAQIYFLMLDFPDMGAGQLLKHSLKIMKGHKMRLFLLRVSFIPLIILCILSFGIGLVWVYPYQILSTTLFFLDIMKPQE